MLEAILEAVLRFVIEVIFSVIDRIFYWLILKALTFRRYPPPQSVPHNRELVACVTPAVFLIAVTLIYTHA